MCLLKQVTANSQLSQSSLSKLYDEFTIDADTPGLSLALAELTASD